MQSILQPWQLLLWSLAGWVQREQQEVVDYLRTENAVLKEKLGKQLQEISTLFTPDALLRWHRQLVVQKWDYADRKEKRQGRATSKRPVTMTPGHDFLPAVSSLENWLEQYQRARPQAKRQA